jgi:hypothetical protein
MLLPKSAVMTPAEERAYMRTFRDTSCECCGAEDGTIVPAHLNLNRGGTGYRAKGIVAGLCHACHDIADGRVAGNRFEIWARVAQTLMRDRAVAWTQREMETT